MCVFSVALMTKTIDPKIIKYIICGMCFIDLFVSIMMIVFIYLEQEECDKKRKSIEKHYVFDKESVKKYYGLLNDIFNEELQILLKTRKAGHEEIGSYRLIARLFKKALTRLNDEKIALRLMEEKKNAKENECKFSEEEQITYNKLIKIINDK